MRAPRPSHALLAALGAAQVRHGLRTRDAPATPRATRGIVALALAASVAEAAEARGPRRGPALVAAAGAVGFAAELAGVRTGFPFGRYRYSERLGPRVGGVPLLASAAWALMARPAWAVAGRITRAPAGRVPLAAAALTAWDVFLDPRMAREGYWTWERRGRYEGIPATNFAGWWGTGLALFAAWAAAERRGPPDRDGAAVAAYLWTWAGETFANAVLWRRPVSALAGSAAMGAVALPALLRRRR
ncbi:carotenoid biosynthesis protein [Miltoncostaea marina]|uniref:carotenoid biosynthesis protein n=1 Tax=Miltoncostaea marina TaxID=2843215 RepID=UPI001C3E36E5|nr:carotenoid biosynthesis protein [Miltoncostaea marina]